MSYPAEKSKTLLIEKGECGKKYRRYADIVFDSLIKTV
jgi:hypothetical protein